MPFDSAVSIRANSIIQTAKRGSLIEHTRAAVNVPVKRKYGFSE
jgi:hypothetical protein